MNGHSQIVAPTVLTARAASKVTDVYMYQFSRVAPSNRSVWGGAAHNMLCQDNAEPLTRQIVQTRAKRAKRRAGLVSCVASKSGGGGVHILRHTFCSHLAMRGAPAIQELAGHKELSMTQRYMHLSPAALDAAIRLLEQPAGPAHAGQYVADARQTVQSFGDMLETGTEGGKTINRSGQ